MAAAIALGVLAGCSDGAGEQAAVDPSTDASAAGGPVGADPDGTISVAYDLIATVRGGKFTLDPAASNTTLSDDSLYYLLYGR
jgi:hypothetical protein